MYQDYVKRCNQGQPALGQPYLYKSADAPWVLNFPTKGHWRTPSRLEDINAGFKYLAEHYEEWGIRSLAMPALGCGLVAFDLEPGATNLVLDGSFSR